MTELVDSQPTDSQPEAPRSPPHSPCLSTGRCSRCATCTWSSVPGTASSSGERHHYSRAGRDAGDPGRVGVRQDA